VAVIDECFDYICGVLRPGLSESEVADELAQAMRQRGAAGPSFTTIVASGARSALPHGVASTKKLEAGDMVTIDMGAIVDGYCSDCTRTVATGHLSDAALEIHDLVRRAQEQALGAVRAAAGCRDVDAVARDLIEEAGHGEHFGHGLGHGVGLEVHEEPRLTKQAEGQLVAGNVVSVEPGIYLPGELGVRIEDLVAVTADGADVFTSFPKTLVTVG